MTTRQDIPRAPYPACAGRTLRSARAVLEHRAGGQVAGRAGDRAAGMGARAGQVQALDAAEAPGTEPALEQLARKHLPVEDVPAGDAEARLELARPKGQAVDDAIGEARADLGEPGDGGVGGGLGVDAGREALAEHGQDVAG